MRNSLAVQPLTLFRQRHRVGQRWHCSGAGAAAEDRSASGARTRASDGGFVDGAGRGAGGARCGSGGHGGGRGISFLAGADSASIGTRSVLAPVPTTGRPTPGAVAARML